MGLLDIFAVYNFVNARGASYSKRSGILHFFYKYFVHRARAINASGAAVNRSYV